MGKLLTINAAVVAYVSVILACAIGWVLNVVAVFNMVSMHAPVDALFMTRLIGIPFFLLGGIIGWL